ncbi:hypothetical protein ASPVEDRAFT_312185 [Aspergillus versicolor CBS 583.65]|uniref:BTB domain-containing protein n=1 Tax=Aspergillus versicolor CBS 583.65 TaxID=1036611 RepID=A0A1L9PXE0_ASPVE|nr:uncharacterized protein ASPVEDRAFT_312185 [Aspergillus versicolor CBS 583.65]OJJ06123.1 hypothetical protein ASPVEDRAFT_312185 [Aspergillus versicolor CBS 583.65]
MSSFQEFIDEITERQRRRAQRLTRHEALVWMSGSITCRRRELTKSLFSLLADPDFSEFSDMTILCRDIRFPCHKAIVCSQSTTIRNSYKEAAMDANTCAVKIKCHPLVLRMALEYLYTCDYSFYLDWGFPTRFTAEGQTVPGDPVDRLDCCELSLHLQVHILAQCLGIQPLMYLSAYKIVRVLSRTSFPTVFPRFVREVYKTFPRKNFLVKRLVVDHAVKVIYERRARNHFDGRFPKFLFGELEEFRLDLAASRTDFPSPLHRYADCGRIASQLWCC